MMYRTFLLILLLHVIATLRGQNTIGLPDIINYEKEKYYAGTQNWGIVQDKKGILYLRTTRGF